MNWVSTYRIDGKIANEDFWSAPPLYRIIFAIILDCADGVYVSDGKIANKDFWSAPPPYRIIFAIILDCADGVYV